MIELADYGYMFRATHKAPRLPLLPGHGRRRQEAVVALEPLHAPEPGACSHRQPDPRHVERRQVVGGTSESPPTHEHPGTPSASPDPTARFGRGGRTRDPANPEDLYAATVAPGLRRVGFLRRIRPQDQRPDTGAVSRPGLSTVLLLRWFTWLLSNTEKRYRSTVPDVPPLSNTAPRSSVDRQLRGMDSGVLPSRMYLWIRNNIQEAGETASWCRRRGDRGPPAAATGRPPDAIAGLATTRRPIAEEVRTCC